ncbi:putative membrane protein [Propionispora sp. 2/2-37]|uniref:hypothetical protein n=1 Tax=Propionispora sp. 2/2-37 TaxID=1677858 RepID=UPI0006BF02C3|nr:hypothetical protein [Propionispora sp. 2/2-37]CUH97410.1 putative membrane protein [Propionispora sp. 2/2-37]
MRKQTIFGLILLSLAVIGLRDLYHNTFTSILLLGTLVPTIAVISLDLFREIGWKH